MEYVNGQTLRDLLRQYGTVPPMEAARIAAEIADALAFAHRNGVVHRDVKPGNVLITSEGAVKVTDFGIARAESSDALTKTGAVLGTATYFSPEQAQGLALDGRSDVYSLGVVLYEMVTGVAPVHRRQSGVGRVQARTRGAGAAVADQTRHPGRARPHRPHRDGEGRRVAVPVGRGVARRTAALRARPPTARWPDSSGRTRHGRDHPGVDAVSCAGTGCISTRCSSTGTHGEAETGVGRRDHRRASPSACCSH